MNTIMIIKVLAFLIAILSVIFHAKAILKKEAKQPQLSWLLWFLVGVFVGYLNYIKNGWDATTITLTGLSIGNVSILILVFKNPQVRWTKLDTKLLVSCIGIFLIWFTVFQFGNSIALPSYIKNHITEISLILLHIPHFIGVIRHWIKVMKDPFSESVSAWSLRLVAFCISIVGLTVASNYTIAWLSPTYGIITTGILLILIKRQRKKIKKWHYLCCFFFYIKKNQLENKPALWRVYIMAGFRQYDDTVPLTMPLYWRKTMIYKPNVIQSSCESCDNVFYKEIPWSNDPLEWLLPSRKIVSM